VSIQNEYDMGNRELVYHIDVGPYVSMRIKLKLD
jgi:hypothetical protein